MKDNKQQTMDNLSQSNSRSKASDDAANMAMKAYNMQAGQSNELMSGEDLQSQLKAMGKDGFDISDK